MTNQTTSPVVHLRAANFISSVPMFVCLLVSPLMYPNRTHLDGVGPAEEQESEVFASDAFFHLPFLVSYVGWAGGGGAPTAEPKAEINPITTFTNLHVDCRAKRAT